MDSERLAPGTGCCQVSAPHHEHLPAPPHPQQLLPTPELPGMEAEVEVRSPVLPTAEWPEASHSSAPPSLAFIIDTSGLQRFLTTTHG